MAPLRRFLLMSLTLALVGGLTYLVTQRLDLGGGDDQVVSGPDGTAAPDTGEATTTTAGSTVVPAPGQVRVTGTITGLHVEGAVLDPRDVPTPLTVVSDRGFGNGGELTGVVVDGAAATVVWDGGRPFVLASGGALVLDPITVDLTTEGLRLTLGGAVHSLAPGTYRLDTPVAVGAAGFASARDAVTFTADASSLFDAYGDAALLLGPEGPRRFLGPGTVRLEGALELTDADGTRTLTSLDTAAGAFELTLTPTGDGGWSVDAVLQGEVTTP